MEIYIVIGLLVFVILLLIILILKNNNKDSRDLVERIGKLDTSLTKDISDFKINFSKDLRTDFGVLEDKIENRLNIINERVNKELNDNFEKSNKTFMNVLERLNKIDEAQKKIEGLNSEIVSLQNVLTDKKTRGTFGEVNLEYILNNAFGSPKSIVKLTTCSVAAAYSSTTKANAAVKPSSLAKSPSPQHASLWDIKTASISATSTQNATGVTPKTTSSACGSSSKAAAPTTMS